MLPLEEVSERLLELVAIFRRDDTPVVPGTEALVDMISYVGHSETWHSPEVSVIVLRWIDEHYDGRDDELVDAQIAVVANLHPQVSIPFFRQRLAGEISDFERREVTWAVAEIEDLVERRPVL